jgi:hypothetical protein
MSNFAFLAAEFPALREAAIRRLHYGNINGTV